MPERWRCRLFGHRVMVRWGSQTTPLWASQMLLAITNGAGCTILCGRCAEILDGAPDA